MEKLTIKGMRAALKKLGISECYHMVTLMNNVDTDPQQWARAIRAKYLGQGQWTKQDWDRLLDDSQAVVDVPAALFGVELAEAYPDAKVVILNRDAEKWYESTLNSVATLASPSPTRIARLLYNLVLDPRTRSHHGTMMLMNKEALGFDHAKEKDKALQWYERVYAEFREKIPEHRRIEFQVQDGWGPLCKHLGVDVPMVKDSTGKMVEAPFPHLNDREVFLANIQKHFELGTKRATSKLFEYIGQAAVVGAAGYFVWRRINPGR